MFGAGRFDHLWGDEDEIEQEYRDNKRNQEELSAEEE